MQQNTPPEQPIKTLDGLKDSHQKITPQILEELKELLKQKYGIDMSKEIFHITREELDTLRAELQGNIDPKTTLERFLYDEYIETILEKDGRSGISLETVTAGIESNTILEMKKKFEQAIDTLLNNYDFLSTASKNTIKLALANKFIHSSGGNDIMNIIGDLKGGIENMSVDSLTSLGNTTQKKEKSGTAESQFLETLQPYIKGWDEIEKKLNEVTPTLTHEQKQNIINNISYFRNPVMIETGWNEQILGEIDITKKYVTEIPLSMEEQKNIKKYLLQSRGKIETIAAQLQGGEQVMEMGLGLMSQENLLGETTKSVVEMLLKIPILGQILAFFLGLNSNDPIGELNEKLEGYKLFNSFKKLGVQKDKDGKITQKGYESLENIDLSEIKYSSIKPEMKTLRKIKGSLSNDDFWKGAWSQNGVEIDGIVFKMELTDTMKREQKISNKDFSTLLKSSIDDFENKKSQNENRNREIAREQEVRQRQQEQQETQTTLVSTQEKIQTYDKIIAGEYLNIPNWHNRIGKSINDMEVSKLLTSGDDFSALIKDLIGEQKYTAIPSISISLLTQTLILLRDFCKEKNISTGSIKDIVGGGIGNHQNRINEFKDFVQTKKSPLSTEIANLNTRTQEGQALEEKTRKAQELQNTLNNIQTETSLSSGNIPGISFEPQNQTLKIDGKNYAVKIQHKIYGNLSLKDIKIDESNITLQVKPFGQEKIKKEEIIDGIYTLVSSGKFHKENNGSSIQIG